MFTLKHLKTVQYVSIIIKTIFSELVCSLLKSVILKFVKNVKVNVVMRQHIVQCYRSPSPYPPQQDTICCKYLRLTLLMMGKILPETC